MSHKKKRELNWNKSRFLREFFLHGEAPWRRSRSWDGPSDISPHTCPPGRTLPAGHRDGAGRCGGLVPGETQRTQKVLKRFINIFFIAIPSATYLIEHQFCYYCKEIGRRVKPLIVAKDPLIVARVGLGNWGLGGSCRGAVEGRRCIPVGHGDDGKTTHMPRKKVSYQTAEDKPVSSGQVLFSKVDLDKWVRKESRKTARSKANAPYILYRSHIIFTWIFQP